MAVDVKSLRIGSHILVDGKRERVRGLDEDNGLIARCILQVWQGKRAVEKGYAAPSEVENKRVRMRRV